MNKAFAESGRFFNGGESADLRFSSSYDTPGNPFVSMNYYSLLHRTAKVKQWRDY